MIAWYNSVRAARTARLWHSSSKATSRDLLCTLLISGLLAIGMLPVWVALGGLGQAAGCCRGAPPLYGQLVAGLCVSPVGTL